MTSIATKRVIALVDMDCFYCQVEVRLNPELQGKPVAVVQYNQWKGGGIIAVNYEAKARGVTRGMRGAQAKSLCPDIQLVSVPVLRGKADLSKYRSAGEEVAKVFSEFSDCIQRASIDEAYIDLTKAVEERIKNGSSNVNCSQLKSTYVVGYCDMKKNNEEDRRAGVKQWLNLMKDNLPDSPDFQLTIGAMIVEEMRAQILEKTGFHCSAGIAHNKILAKLIAGLHKPKHQTLLPQDHVPELYETLPIHKISSLGGKFGQMVAEKLSIQFMSELYPYSLQELQQKFDVKDGTWLYNIARGIDLDPVTTRLIPESIGCCKNFPGVQMLSTKTSVERWIRELAEEISERLKADLVKNKRRAKTLTVSFYQSSPMSRSDSLYTYETDGIVNKALELLNKFNNASNSSDEWDPPLKFLGLSAGRFVKEQTNLDVYLANLKAGKSDNETVNSEPSSASTKEPESKSDGSENSFFLNFLKNNRHKLAQKNNLKDSGACERVETKIKEEEISLPSTSASVVNDTNDLAYECMLCEECNQNINVLDFFEHLDYHAAVRLQAEINEEVKTRPSVVIPKSVGKQSEPNTKRKRVSGDKVAAKKVRDIKSFFQVITK